MHVLTARAEGDAPCDAELVLPFELRVKTRVLARTTAGEDVGIILPRGGEPLHDGDVLVAADGYRVRVVAAREMLLHATCTDATELARAAYHLGNRHVKVEVGPGWLRIADDDVLGAMLVQLGATVVRVEDVFRPEHGAYGGGHHHSHGQDDDMHYAPRIHQFGLIDR